MDTSTLKVSVVLPAAGSGTRLGGPQPKQYIQIQNQPLFSYALQHFDSLPFLTEIVLVVDNKSEIDNILLELNFTSRVRVVEGGTTRHRSIFAGVKSLEPCDIVLIHDAVRPFIPDGLVHQLSSEAHLHGASGVMRPLTSTVLQVDELGFMKEALNRSKYVASETPQAFRYAALISAYKKCTDADFDFGTECLDLVDKYESIKAKLINGSEDLWKVTYKKDIYAARGIMKDSTKSLFILGKDCDSTGISYCLKECLQHRIQVSLSGDKRTQQTYNYVLCIEISSFPCRGDITSVINADSKDSLVITVLQGFIDTYDKGATIHNLHSACRSFMKNLCYKCICIILVSETHIQKLCNIIQDIIFSDNNSFNSTVLIV